MKKSKKKVSWWHAIALNALTFVILGFTWQSPRNHQAVTTPIAVTDSTYVDSTSLTVDTSFTENTVDSVYLDAIEHLKSYEGFRSQVYLDTDGSRTIGYGHHLRRGETYQNINDSLATAILTHDLKIRMEAIEDKYEVTGDTLLALGLFSFNCGMGLLDEAIKNGILTKPTIILSYCHYKTYDSQGGVIWHTFNKLSKRRKYELALITKQRKNYVKNYHNC